VVRGDVVGANELLQLSLRLYVERVCRDARVQSLRARVRRALRLAVGVLCLQEVLEANGGSEKEIDGRHASSRACI